MVGLMRYHMKTRLGNALGFVLTLSITACTGARFSTAPETSDGHDSVTSVRNSGSSDAGSNGSSTNSTVCGTGRADSSSKAVDICIPAGQFTMGTTAANLGGTFSDHSPPHAVDLSSYFIDAYEVTVSRFRACVSDGACDPPSATGAGCTFDAQPSSADSLPVNCVLYATAVAFCKWDGGRRLPTEAEWERAARGTAQS